MRIGRGDTQSWPAEGRPVVHSVHCGGQVLTVIHSPGINDIVGRNPLLDAMIGRDKAQAGTARISNNAISRLNGLHCPHIASPVELSRFIRPCCMSNQ